MALKTDFKNDIFEGNRKYQIIQNDDGTYSFIDVTEYTQEGDVFGANDINDTNSEVNRVAEELSNEKESVIPLKRGGTGKAANTEAEALNALANHTVTTANTSLDDYTEPGVYYFSSSYTPTDIPVGVNGWLVVLPNNGANLKQLWFRQGTGNTNDYNTYIRTGISNTWSSWRRFFTDADTVGVANGGTGVTTMTSGAALIGNGTGAPTFRSITNLTAKGNATGSANLATANTVVYHSQARLNRTTNVHAADANYTIYMARGIALVDAVPTSMVNGAVAFVY